MSDTRSAQMESVKDGIRSLTERLATTQATADHFADLLATLGEAYQTLASWLTAEENLCIDCAGRGCRACNGTGEA